MRPADELPHTVAARLGKELEAPPFDTGPPPAAPLSARGTSVGSPNGAVGGIALIVATVVVDALAPLLQERASRRPGFSSSAMVLAETMSYYWGGLLLATVSDGLSGVRRCLRPARYAAFLPASAAFSTSNFLTYIAVRGLGASQFYLLAQLRVAVLAVFLRVWSGVRQPALAWLALLQLAVGMVVLVWIKAAADEVTCVSMAPVGALFAVGAFGNATGRGSPARSTALAQAVHDAAVAAEHAAFAGGIVALTGVVLASSFGFLYLEWQLKMHAQDPLFVQLHQMNSFGAAASLLIRLGHSAEAVAEEGPARVSDPSVSFGLRPSSNVTGHQLATGAAALLAARTSRSSEGSGLQANLPSLESVVLLTCIITRGVLSGSVLKQLGAISKGLIDVTAIVLCTGLQMLIHGSSTDGTVVGIQVLMLLSIISYIIARSSTPVPVPRHLPDLPMLELRDTAVLSARPPPKVL